ncbi:hypothetical protein [Streptomyces goshikiensis]|uniref:hypothetical protein n=1 Tax=Streptomyces goshikiensis TaxID=1942 RepID=UPI00367BAE9B
MDEIIPAGPDHQQQTQPGVLHGVIVDDPGTPCTPEYARELTTKAAQLADQLDDTMQEIVRVKAWVPLGYRDPRQYVLAEFTQSSRSHRYRLARFAAFAHGMSERLGDEALELQITERALREVPQGRDDQVLNALESRLAETDNPKEANEAVKATLREHSRNAPPPEEDMWDGETAEPSSRPGGGGQASPRADDDGWGADDGFDPDGFEDDGAQTSVHPAATPPSKAALAEAGRYEEFLRAMRVIAATGPELPDILDNADGPEETELAELAQRVGGVAAATEEALAAM